MYDDRSRESGQTLLELVATLIILIPTVLLFLDLLLIAVVVQINDDVARNATRQASNGAPSSPGSPGGSGAGTLASIAPQSYYRAKVYVDQANKSHSGAIANIAITNSWTNLTSADIQNWQISGGELLHHQGNQVSTGLVSITTSVQVRPFVLPWVLASSKVMTFNATHTFPFSYVGYYSGSGNPNSNNPWTIIPTGRQTSAKQ